MSDPSPEDLQLLRDARGKAEKLLAGLLAQQDDLDRSPPKIAPDKLAQGRQAFANAIASARRTLDNIDQALALAADARDNAV